MGTESPEAAIQVEDLVVVRGGKKVLPNLSTLVRRGGITGLLGPSGSGKTTLMRAIVGVQRVRSGRVTVLGEPAGSPSLRHRIGYFTQSPSVYTDMTVRENVRYFARLYDFPKPDVRADAAIEEVGLGDQAGQLVGTLSGGQHNRASLACALVSRPELLVLDEPTVGLDPVLREELWDSFRKLASEGATLLVSSHVMDEANRCERLILLRDGAIVADDTTQAIKDRAGTNDLDRAFLTLVQQHEEVA
ncbi:ABC transporter ATP-binding protein [Streptomyces sp. AJS327]|uniref:ABC transporter ATP-binding protein n=1 Tax=Streptomyces sp. AJS327 TaxID=2545265 RepID=UPI0015DDFD27|nr:ABC transporter ATP-binding protein [Streptomyces sp. AJS327]MBA0053734.1 ABC transporter ATP-binding protein [Streptomyces sp. AJS327]